MLLIKDLGTEEYGTKGKRRRYGLYECPVCKIHFRCSSSAVKSKHTTKCRSCSYTRSRNNQSTLHAKFLDKALAVHGNLYTYDNVSYVDALTKILITCKTHGNWEQTPGEHIRGRGCPKCSYQDRKNTTEEFITKSKIVFGPLTFDYTPTAYVDSETKLEIICKVHGSFFTLPHNHLKGVSCPGCAKYGFDPSKAAILYYLKVRHENILLYKIGITNRSVIERFNPEDRIKIDILKLWDYPIGKDAYIKEQEILKLHKKLKYTGPLVLQSGNTELFTEDVLGLDFTLQ